MANVVPMISCSLSISLSLSLSLFLSLCVCVCVCVLQYIPPTAVNTTLRLKSLRDAMKQQNISAYIIPGTDAHLVVTLPLLMPLPTSVFIYPSLSAAPLLSSLQNI